MENLVEQILSEMKNKKITEFFTEESFAACEQVKYKLWDDYRVEIHAENKKLLVCVWKK